MNYMNLLFDNGMVKSRAKHGRDWFSISKHNSFLRTFLKCPISLPKDTKREEIAEEMILMLTMQIHSCFPRRNGS